GTASFVFQQKRASEIVVAPAGGEASDAPEVVLRLGRMEHDLVQRVVLDDAAARQVLRPSLGLAPGGDSFQTTKHRRVAARELEALPRVLRSEGEARRV